MPKMSATNPINTIRLKSLSAAAKAMIMKGF